MSNSITDAIAQASAAAASLAPPQMAPQVPAQYAAPAQAVAPLMPGRPMGLDDVMVGSMAVDAWLKVDGLGLLVGTDKKLHDELKVGLRMSDIQYKMSIKYNLPSGSTVYEHTYDRVVSDKGKPWSEVIMAAQRISPDTREFKSADLPFIVLEDIIGKNGKDVVLQKGKTLGHSLSTTGFKQFVLFVKELSAKGINPHNALVQIDLGFIEKSNAKASKPWGVLDFRNPVEIGALPWETN